ncbi:MULTISPECIES: hypothetical protein [unclassified Bartonella]|uniref:hypothetical protein n=1 Tax=unclassified Bartonella TaxID=2645622 RepID=UPI000999D42B|nr:MULTISPECIES: hypothetical protein [unclassified Bartonella]AQX27859.1 hypothetical protein BJB15x_004480 [Bartonella sp. JB15]AQX29140.1 hypothetical protein BJB63x_004470 [Bartonella sp. JB63]
MDICTFWYGKQLRQVDWLCLASMVKTGQRVKLFSYEKVEIPVGVELHEAESILPRSIFYRLDPNFPSYEPSRTIVQFSDLFRIMLMKYQKGVWLDTDVYLVKQFHPKVDQVWLAKENTARVGVSALYLPPDNPIIKAFDDYLASTEIIPDWLGFKRRVWIPFWLRRRKLPVLPGRIGITIFGNDGISRLAKRYGFFHEAKEKKTFYYWTGRKAERIFDPAFGVEPIKDSCFIGFHIHRKEKTTQKPQEGSFYHWAVSRIPGAQKLFE